MPRYTGGIRCPKTQSVAINCKELGFSIGSCWATNNLAQFIKIVRMIEITVHFSIKQFLECNLMPPWGQKLDDNHEPVDPKRKEFMMIYHELPTNLMGGCIHVNMYVHDIMWSALKNGKQYSPVVFF